MTGMLIKQIRTNNRIKQYLLARASGLRQSYLSDIERGVIPITPRIESRIVAGFRQLKIEISNETIIVLG